MRVALLKRITAQGPRDPARESAVRDHYAAALGPSGWSRQSLDAWLGTMLSVSRDLQAQLAVAIQGGPGSWSEASLRTALPGVRIIRCASFLDAEVEAIEGRAAAAWLPVHNSQHGDVLDNVGRAREMETWMEWRHRIRHALLAPPRLELAQVRHVEAHPRALEQCARTLARLVPHADLVPTIDGAHSAQSVADRPATAVVASAEVAATTGLRILHEAIADDASNATTFRLLVPREVY